MLARRRLCLRGAAALLLSLLVASAPPCAWAASEPFEAVDIAVAGRHAATIKAYVRRPPQTSRAQKTPVVVGVHGCGGLIGRNGLINAREADWADRWIAAGYAVVLPDSFNPRGYRQICTLDGGSRPIRPRDRAEDVLAVAAWLQSQPFADPQRIALVGWSNGGSTVLSTVSLDRAHRAPGFVTAVAFYPGCAPVLRRAGWTPRVPLTILIGDSDDWTPPQPCRELAAGRGIRLIEYPGAVHAFDTPNLPLRTRSDVGVSARGDGRVQVGTDPAARAAAIGVVSDILSKAFAAAKK